MTREAEAMRGDRVAQPGEAVAQGLTPTLTVEVAQVLLLIQKAAAQVPARRQMAVAAQAPVRSQAAGTGLALEKKAVKVPALAGLARPQTRGMVLEVLQWLHRGTLSSRSRR